MNIEPKKFNAEINKDLLFQLFDLGIATDLINTYNKHRKYKGDSWKNESLLYLFNKLHEEYTEIKYMLYPEPRFYKEIKFTKIPKENIRKVNDERLYKELCDLVLVALMIMSKYKYYENSR